MPLHRNPTALLARTAARGQNRPTSVRSFSENCASFHRRRISVVPNRAVNSEPVRHDPRGNMRWREPEAGALGALPRLIGG